MIYVRAQTSDGDIVTGHLINSGRSYYVLQDVNITIFHTEKAMML